MLKEDYETTCRTHVGSFGGAQKCAAWASLCVLHVFIITTIKLVQKWHWHMKASLQSMETESTLTCVMCTWTAAQQIGGAHNYQRWLSFTKQTWVVITCVANWWGTKPAKIFRLHKRVCWWLISTVFIVFKGEKYHHNHPHIKEKKNDSWHSIQRVHKPTAHI